MGERGSSDAPGCLGLLLVIGFVALAVGAIGSVFSGGDDSGGGSSNQLSPLARSEALVARTAKSQVARTAAHPDEWIVYSRCNTPSNCTAELRYEGLPTAPMAVERYRVRNGKAARRGAAKIEVVLVTDKLSDCTGTYLLTEDPRDLMACAPGA